MQTPNLVRPYTIHGPMMIDTARLNSERQILRIYDSKGRKLSDSGRTAAIRETAAFGVHRANLFATKRLAEENHARVLAELFPDS